MVHNKLKLIFMNQNLFPQNAGIGKQMSQDTVPENLLTNKSSLQDLLTQDALAENPGMIDSYVPENYVPLIKTR
jgi:hypothetical protein